MEYSELIKLANNYVKEEKTSFTSPTAVMDFLKPLLINEDQEKVILLALNAKNHVIDSECIFIGGFNSCTADPRVIFSKALKKNASKITIAHNHPSGSTKPSLEDFEITKKLFKCGEILGVEFLDHIIVGYKNPSALSLKENNIELFLPTNNK
ncbi:MAG: JAB domain-containing protein [Candidatus Helarchaeota archaeon]